MGRRFSGKYAAGRRGGDVHSPGTVAEMRNFERMRGSAGTACDYMDGGRKAARWRCGCKIPSERLFRMHVFLPQTGSETRNFKRTRRPAGTACCCKDGGRKAAQWCCGYEISAERSFHMHVFLPQTVSEMGLRENAPPCWHAIAVAGTVAVGSGAPTFRS